MKIIIHDLPDEKFAELFAEKITSPESTTVISQSSQPQIHNCLGCFGCWVKSPGECVIRDSCSYMGKLLSRCDRLVIISRTCYGGYSPFVKNVLDRCLPHIHPYFVTRNGEMHHKRRYSNRFTFVPLLYGDSTEDERAIALRLVKANAVNFDSDYERPMFYTSADDLKEASL